MIVSQTAAAKCSRRFCLHFKLTDEISILSAREKKQKMLEEPCAGLIAHSARMPRKNTYQE